MTEEKLKERFSGASQAIEKVCRAGEDRDDTLKDVLAICKKYGFRGGLQEKTMKEKGPVTRIKDKDSKKVKIIPITKEHWKYREEIFPIRFSKEPLVVEYIKETNEHLLILQRVFKNTSVTYKTFVPGKLEHEELPKFGKMTQDVYIALIKNQFAQLRKSQGVSTWVHCTIPEILQLIGYSKETIKQRPSLFSRAERSLQTIAYTLYDIKDNRTGEVLSIQHLLSYKKSSPGRGFDYILLDDQINLLLNLVQEKKTDQYIGYPAGLLPDTQAMPTPIKRIINYLLTLQTLKKVYPISLKKLLIDEGKIPPGKIKQAITAGEFGQFVSDHIFDPATKAGIIKGYKYKSQTNLEDPTTWKVLFYMKKGQIS